MKLIHGDAFAFLDELNPRFIVTDCNKEDFARLLEWCESRYTILINAYSTRWLTAANPHPAQKRVDPYRSIIQAFPEEPVVCDPFMGTGTIGVAALSCGRDFIGIERYDDWFHVAKARIDGFQNAQAGENRAMGTVP